MSFFREIFPLFAALVVVVVVVAFLGLDVRGRFERSDAYKNWSTLGMPKKHPNFQLVSFPEIEGLNMT